MIAARLGANLRETRRVAGLSQEAVALRASLHRTEVGLLERGERVPRIDTLIRMAGALGVSVGELVKGVEWVPGTASLGGFRVAVPDAHSGWPRR